MRLLGGNITGPICSQMETLYVTPPIYGIDFASGPDANVGVALFPFPFRRAESYGDDRVLTGRKEPWDISRLRPGLLGRRNPSGRHPAAAAAALTNAFLTLVFISLSWISVLLHNRSNPAAQTGTRI